MFLHRFVSALTRSTRVASVALGAALLSNATGAASDEWPQFRGPDGQGHADTAVPVSWSETENIVWKTTIPGEGHSSPVISDNQIWLTSAIEVPLSDEEQQARLANVSNSQSLRIAGKLTLTALQVNRDTGEIVRQIPVFEITHPEPKHSLNSYASPTPVLAGSRVFVHFGTYGTACIDRESREIVWRNDELRIDHQNGPGSSPVIWEDRLLLHFDGIDAQYIAALNTAHGELLWKTMRSGLMDPKPDLQKGYSTPLVVELADRPVVISPAANWVYGYDARDGKEVWRASYGQLGFSTVPRPVIRGNTAYIATSYMQSKLLAVQIDGEGDVTDSHIRWTSEKQIPKKPSMLVSGDRLYLVSDGGVGQCLDAESGEELWTERLPGEYSASPLSAAGRIYFFSQDGTTTVFEDSGNASQLASNKLDGSLMASPAAAGNALFLRTDTSLYRIEVR